VEDGEEDGEVGGCWEAMIQVKVARESVGEEEEEAL
jgi:hypothetical protein